MKLESGSQTPSPQEMAEMLSKMKTLLIDVLLEKTLADSSRNKLKDCISMVECFSNFLNNNCKKEEDNSSNLRQPLHSGLSRSTECLPLGLIGLNQSGLSKSSSDLASIDLFDNDKDKDIDLNSLKENYLQAVKEFKNSRDIIGNAQAEVDYTKPEVNYDKPETHRPNPDVNSTESNLINLKKEQNAIKPAINGVKQEVNWVKPEVSEAKPEVVRREGERSKRRRKRDSSTLFDISLDDLTEPDHSGFLTEKHSGKEWWCVLQDQHLCMFPSQNPQELAYDVLLVPCCEIALDDVYTESPVFRLTQVGSTPWVFSAGIERNLRAWIRALYRACGRDDADWSMRRSKKGRRKDKQQKRNMKVLTSTIDESEEMEEENSGLEFGNLDESKVEEQEEMEGGFKAKENKEMEVEKTGPELEDEDGGKVKEKKELESGLKAKENKEMEGEKRGLHLGDEDGGRVKEKEEVKSEIKATENKEMGVEKTGPKLGDEDGSKVEKQMEREAEAKTIENKEIRMIGRQEVSKNEDDLTVTKEMNKENIMINQREDNKDYQSKEVEVETADVPEVNKQTSENELDLNEVKKVKEISESEDFKVEYYSDQKGFGKQYETNENESLTSCPPNFAFDDDHDDYVISLQSAGQPQQNAGKKSSTLPSRLECDESVQTRTIERKATKKRIKMLRWLKKALVDKGQDNVTVVGDIYKIDSTGNHVKLWCLLSDRQLNCYLNVSDTTPDFVIPLDNCIAIPYPGTMAKQYLFDIEKDGVKLATFAARSTKERARWIEIVKTKRGTIPLGDFGDESGEEAGESGTSEEEDDGYVEVDRQGSGELSTKAEYVLAMSEDEVSDAGYISVVALESEIVRRRTYKQNKQFNPNIAHRSGIEFLIEKNTPSFLSTLPKDPKRRSPAPLPRDAVLKSGKSAEISKGVPSIYVDSEAEQNIRKELELKLNVKPAMKDHVDSDDKDVNNNLSTESLERISGEFTDDEASCSEESGVYYQVTASSWLPDSPPSQARFVQRMSCEGSIGAWRPETNDKLQFLEIDIGDAMTLGAIGVKGRPDFEEKGGEFVKSFTLYYSINNETWFPYKSHGKLKVFQGISNPSQEYKKYFKNRTVAQYLRIYPQSWHNHIALQVALYKGNDYLDMKSKVLKKKGNNSKPTTPGCEISQVSPTMAGAKKTHLKKEDISNPMHPSSDCLRTEVANPVDIKENGIRIPNGIEPQPLKDTTDNPASMESRVELRKKLLSKEKREQITKLEVLKKHVDQAKDKMIVVNSSGQLKREAIESEHDYLTANLELVKAKKRLIDIETEMRELRLFGEKYSAEQQLEVETPKEIVKDGKPVKEPEVETPKEIVKDGKPVRKPEVEIPKEIVKDGKPVKKPAVETPKEVVRDKKPAKKPEVETPKEVITRDVKPAKPPLRRRPSKEVMVCTDIVSPVVDHEAFNSPGDPPPPRKVMDNVKLFETLQNQ